MNQLIALLTLASQNLCFAKSILPWIKNDTMQDVLQLSKLDMNFTTEDILTVNSISKIYPWQGNLTKSISLTNSDKQNFLHFHNLWRNKTAAGELNNPPASQIPALLWDDDLAEASTKYSNLCNWAHSVEVNYSALPYRTGENLYLSWRIR